ncbi:MAG: diaminopimelate epimerase [Bacteroidales bacterium]
MKFTKMHGAGNDYIYLHDPHHKIENPEALAIRMSDRHFGIGADGIVLILPSDKADFRMRMFNADGSEAQMCGNASRCVGKYVYEKRLTDKTHVRLETKAGIKILALQVEGGKVKSVMVDMGEPILAPASIPVQLPGDSIVNREVVMSAQSEQITCVSMGNPHTVLFVDSMETTDVHGRGVAIENDPLFPERTNVEFIEIESPTRLRMRVWERGSGETLACGTGACASVVAGVLNGRCERDCAVNLLGGTLQIRWDEASNHVFLSGDATNVFEGEWVES